MLERRQQKSLPPREQVVIDGSLPPVDIKEITHIRLFDSSFGIPEGVYQYNSGNQCVTSLDDDMMGRLSMDVMTKAIANTKALLVQTFRHLPTWSKMIESGEVVDSRVRTDEEKEVEEKIKNTINPPVRRKLLM